MHNHRRYQSISCNIKEATKWRKVRWTKANTIIKSAFLLLWPLILTPGMPSRSLARFSDIPHWTLSRRCGFLSDKKTDLELFLFLFLSQVHLKRTSLQRNKCLLDVKVRQLVTEVLKYGTLFEVSFFFQVLLLSCLIHWYWLGLRGYIFDLFCIAEIPLFWGWEVFNWYWN